MYFVILKRHEQIISSPAAFKQEADIGNPTIGHLVCLIEAYKVCTDLLFFHIISCSLLT